jgi:hypothetical protein
MATPNEFFKWWYIDERTGERRRTAYKLNFIDAERAFPGAEPDLSTREAHDPPAVARASANSRRRGE